MYEACVDLELKAKAHNKGVRYDTVAEIRVNAACRWAIISDCVWISWARLFRKSGINLDEGSDRGPGPLRAPVPMTAVCG